MESHSYHGAYVISGCDKTPLALIAGLAHLDMIRQRRGDAPVFATFHSSHVLRGGTIPPALHGELEAVATRAEERGLPDIAHDMRYAMSFILQCTANSTFQGVLTRAREEGLITYAEHKAFERELAINTCHPAGGVCAFNGTGNSSRHMVSALGLGHPVVELLTEPATTAQVNRVVDDLFTYVNRPEYSVGPMVCENFANAVRVHSATGGSTNLMLHLVAAMLYAGYNVDVRTIDHIRRTPPVPDIFDYSLTEGRDIFVFAQQCCSGEIRGMETIFYELLNQGIPMDVDAPTSTGTPWSGRLADTTNLSAAGVRENPIVLSSPRRPFSGVEVLHGNLWESAVVKISGMTSDQLADFDDKIGVTLFFENEDVANAGLLDIHILDRLRDLPDLDRSRLFAIARCNCRGRNQDCGDLLTLERAPLFDRMVEVGLLKVVIVISGQGPQAFGMPEMFTPMQHINANRELRKLTVLVSDGRYSGVTYGAAIGHVTPEALDGGAIGLLQTGDLLHIQLSKLRVDIIDPDVLDRDGLQPRSDEWMQQREDLGRDRRQRILERRRQIAATNRLMDVTDASRGVVPRIVAAEATLDYPPHGS